MLQGNDWSDIFHNIENKEDMVRLVVDYLVQGRLQTLPLLPRRKKHGDLMVMVLQI